MEPNFNDPKINFNENMIDDPNLPKISDKPYYEEPKQVNLKKIGFTSYEKIIKKRRWLRNTYRNLLRKKLNKWKKNPNKVNDVMDFDSVQIDKLNKEVNT